MQMRLTAMQVAMRLLPDVFNERERERESMRERAEREPKDPEKAALEQN